ncbi:MAG: AAA family ATPase, partial [Bacteroidaceae bacterium]|nr:AAA family ATPase [Bacteroidaceae bacterium]
MDKIEIKNFKAFGGRLAINPTTAHKNVLIYGENGAGKTSLYEAIMLAFYREKMLRPHLSVGAPAEQRANEEKDFYNGYNHKTEAGTPEIDFTIKINNGDFKAFNTDTYQCFMVSANDLNYVTHEIQNGKVVEKDCVNLKKLLETVNFPDFDIDAFLAAQIGNLIQAVNDSLKNDFVEGIEIGRENDQYDIYIKDDANHLRESNGLHAVFNEAKINLVVILLLLHAVDMLQAVPAAGMHKLLVLDDLVTSLDNSNRLYLARFILSKFTRFQKILFTHSIGFNNM